jgi:hypothetical protein
MKWSSGDIFFFVVPDKARDDTNYWAGGLRYIRCIDTETFGPFLMV